MIDTLKDNEKQISITYNTREEALERMEYMTELLVKSIPGNFRYTDRTIRSIGGGQTSVVFKIEEI